MPCLNRDGLRLVRKQEGRERNKGVEELAPKGVASCNHILAHQYSRTLLRSAEKQAAARHPLPREEWFVKREAQGYSDSKGMMSRAP
jgi:hypothetical protein